MALRCTVVKNFAAEYIEHTPAYINHLPERKTGERLKNLLPSATNYINLRHTVHGLKRKKINRAKIRPITEHGTGLFRSHVTEWSVLIGWWVGQVVVDKCCDWLEMRRREHVKNKRFNPCIVDR